MKSRLAIWGGLVFFVLIAAALWTRAACAADPYFVKCKGAATYYIRDASLHTDTGEVSGWKYVIERDDILFSWGYSADDVDFKPYKDFDGAPLSGVVPYAPGTLLKVADYWDVYAVTRSRILRRLDTPGVAVKFFGSDWETKIKDLPAAWMQHYRLGVPIIAETWLSPSEREVSARALYEATDPRFQERAALLRDRQRIAALQEVMIPFLHDQVRAEGRSAPAADGKISLGSLEAGTVWATDDYNDRFRRVPATACEGLSAGHCILPAPDAQINTGVCGTQAPYGYENKNGFELSFCIETWEAQWMPRGDDFDDVTTIRNLRPGWYKYTPAGLERISA